MTEKTVRMYDVTFRSTVDPHGDRERTVRMHDVKCGPEYSLLLQGIHPVRPLRPHRFVLASSTSNKRESDHAFIISRVSATAIDRRPFGVGGTHYRLNMGLSGCGSEGFVDGTYRSFS